MLNLFQHLMRLLRGLHPIAMTILTVALFIGINNLLAEHVFTDEIGEEVRVDRVPSRIVSLAPGITETLFAIGAGGRIVGVTDFCDYPEEAKSRERVGGFVNPNIEKVLSLKPEIVFSTKDGNDPLVVKRLKRLGIRVYVTNPRNFKGLLMSIQRISELLGLKEGGLNLVENMRKHQEIIEQRIKGKRKRRVLFLYGTEPMISAGQGTLADDLITLAGGINVCSDSKVSYLKLNLESAIARKPDVVIVTTMGEEGLHGLEKLEKVFGHKVKLINGDIVDRPGPRIIDGLEELYRIIHGAEE